jgi:multisubunit Na+/H+ antiporter MnhE subunit
MRRIALCGLCVVLTALFYLVLIDTFSSPELYAGLGVLVLAVIAFDASRGQGVTGVVIETRLLRRAYRALVHIPADIAVVCRAALLRPLGRAPRGEFRAIPFRTGTGETDAGRHALAELAGSLAPNTIVIGVDPDSQLLLVHQLTPRGGRGQLDVMQLG